MEKKFTSDEVPLAQILNQAANGSLQLPDFQRGWVWDDQHIASLLASISLSYPIGAVMTLQAGNPDVRFRPRPLEGVVLSGPAEPEYLLLDGQQRLTSLYMALRSGSPVPTRDSRNNEMSRIYFADMRACLDPYGDRDEAIVGLPADGISRNFRSEITRDVSTRERQIAMEMFPLSIVLDFAETMNWQLAYLKDGPGSQQERLDVWQRFTESVINHILHYQVPTIALVRSTPKEAVCQVFEKVNTGGVSLTVFELLTATYAADDFNLRADWESRRSELSEPLLERFESTDFLQILTLLSSFERRRTYLAGNPGDEKAPAVSCKRKDVLRLELADYRKWADEAIAALHKVVRFLQAERVYKATDLPYATQLVPLAAIFAVLGEKVESHRVSQMLQQWYWCGVLGEMYGGSTETRFANDLQDVVAWVEVGEDEPRTVQEAQFQASRLLTLRSRNSAAYKGVYALQIKRGGRDFRTGQPIDVHAYLDNGIDVRHIFPQRWCVANGIADGIANCIVNKTALNAWFQRQMNGRAPSVYLARIEAQREYSSGELDAILRSHDIDSLALRQDDFVTFFNSRFERLLRQIEEAMRKPVNRTADRAESPFSQVESAEAVESGIRAVISSGESKVVEFKSTGRRNLKTGVADPAMEWSVIKTLAAFMNTYGGTLLIGVADNGSIVGIEEDYPVVSKKNQDGWELWLTTLTTTSLGKVAAAELDVKIGRIDGRTVARIDVGPAAKPVFATAARGGDKKPMFMVRLNNSTHELVGQEALEYQQSRWPS